ncbi:CG2 omega domain protein [Vibrio methylphosphonaticus]|uniref:CG2 omega domain protein n=1 Tax=Vibrio methylphosphonaticus TaxID=2946866 RepID=UPI002029D76B|nr:CG2 omega domain protein [Vibrio methylphosphonaticus]MCL9773797.1 CG2 omega domain protein [Vibrio methylphosphonaticus]
MRKLIFILTAMLLPVSISYASISIKGDHLELSEDCINYESKRVKIESEECDSKHRKGKNDRSVHGKDNPGKGHGKKK